MQRKIQKAILLSLLVAAITLPPVIFHRYVGAYAQRDTDERLGEIGRRMTTYVEQILDAGIDDMAALVSYQVGECGPSAREHMISVLDRNRMVQQVIVADATGKEMCGAFLRRRTAGRFVSFDPSGHSLELGRMAGLDDGQTYFGIRQWLDNKISLTLVYSPSAFYLDILPDAWRTASEIMLYLDNQSQFVISDTLSESAVSQGGAFVTRRVGSERFPVSIGIRLRSDVVAQDFLQLQKLGTAAMAVLSFVIGIFGVFLIFRPPSIDEDLRQAIRDRQFIPFYQPVIDLERGRLAGCEVLVRRRLPDGTIVSPVHFIDHLEHNGMILEVTRRLMMRVCDDLGGICRDRPDLYVTFNLCSLHFRDERIVDDVQAIFADSSIRYDRLVFEITERLPLDDLDMANRVIAKLQALGCRIALDDAGTGHAGLAILQQIPFDIIKIDKFFIDTITAAAETPIIDTIMTLGRSLDKIIVAEGVESMVQLNHLRARGLRFAQGHLFAPPLPPKAFIRLARQFGAAGPGAVPITPDMGRMAG